MKENEKGDKYLEFAKELKKTMEHDRDGDTNCNRCAQYSHQRISKGTGRLENNRTSGNYPNCNILNIDQNSENTEKSPGDLSRLAVTQTPVEDHQFTLVRKIS